MLILIKIGYSGYGIGFNAHSQFQLPDCNWGKNVSTFGVDNSSPVHADNKKKKDILFLGGSLAQGLHDTTITAEAKYSINFTESGRRFVLSPY